MNLQDTFERERWMRALDVVNGKNAEKVGFIAGANYGFRKAIELLKTQGKVMSFSRDGDRWADWLESKLDEK